MTATFFSLVGLYGIILYHLIIPTLEYDTKTLVLVHVVFRHGNRTPDKTICYPNDPHNESYYPFGLGQLTNKGKFKEFQIGKSLRNRYDSFLGNVYTPEILDAIARPFNRTKMSLELLLAGLFPPANTLLEWNKALNWQPIPYSYVLETLDLLGSPLWNCPNYDKIFEKFIKSPDGLATQAPYKELFDYVKIHTGWNVTTNLELWSLYNTLDAQFDWGLELPQWANKIYPEALNERGGQIFIQFTYTPDLRRLSGGFLLKKIIDDSRAKIEGKLIPQERKLFLYSAHDLTIGNTLGAMKLMYPHNPPFGAYLLIELHKINNVYGFKVFYENYNGSTPLLMTIPGCDTFCPFDKFVELHDSCLPIGNDPCGHNDENADNLTNLYYENNLRHIRCAL